MIGHLPRAILFDLDDTILTEGERPMVGDASVFRSAYSEALDHWFRLLVEQSFGTGRGIYIGPANGELAYTPKYVLSDDEILALVNAASILFGDD